MFFIPTSLSAILISQKEKLINWKIGLPIACSGIVGAIMGARVSMKMEVKTLKKYFGIFLLLIAIYEIYLLLKEYKKRKRNNNNNNITI